MEEVDHVIRLHAHQKRRVRTRGHRQKELHENESRQSFTLGVASGNPKEDSVALWTRLTQVISAPPMNQGEPDYRRDGDPLSQQDYPYRSAKMGVR